MPVRLITPSERAERILFEGIVDYAGLYPPATLSMPVAVRNYAHYRAGSNGWMLGRFICPAAALERFSVEAEALLPRDAGAIPWRLSVTGSGDLPSDLAAIATFNRRHVICFNDVGAVVDTIEVKAATVQEIEAIDNETPREVTTYIEIPIAADPAPLLDAIARVGRRPKMRMGGTTADAFPSSAHVVRFLAQCVAAKLTAKATAGLHHPVCGTYRLTYDEHAVRGRMFGFVNLFLATALLANGGTTADAIALLEEVDVSTITSTEAHTVWHHDGRDIAFDRALLHRVREQLLVSFGSCSFIEPVDESRALGLL